MTMLLEIGCVVFFKYWRDSKLKSIFYGAVIGALISVYVIGALMGALIDVYLDTNYIGKSIKNLQQQIQQLQGEINADGN